MKNLIIAVAVAAFAFTACNSSFNPDNVSIETPADSISYLIGFDYGNGMVTDMSGIPGKPMNNDAIAIGFLNGLFGDDSLVTVADNEAFLNGFFNTLRNKMSDTTAVADTVKAEGGSPISGYNFNTSLASGADTASYLLGYQFGKSFAQGFDEMPGESLTHTIVGSGFVNGIKEEEAKIEVEDRRAYVQEYFNRTHTTEQDAYLEENAKNDSVTVTESGLQYQILTEGTGAVPKPEDNVKVHYTGTLINGTKFDSSVDRGQPAVFGCTQVIKGWTEALTMMPVGSKWKLTIPQDLAYGTQQIPGIPAKSTLVFTVELLEIVAPLNATPEK